MSTSGAPLTEAEVMRVRAWVDAHARSQSFLPLVAGVLAVSSWFSSPPRHSLALGMTAAAVLIGAVIGASWLRQRKVAARLRAGVATELVSGPYFDKRGRHTVGPTFANRLVGSVALEAPPPSGGWSEARALSIDPPGRPGMGRWVVVQWVKTRPR